MCIVIDFDEVIIDDVDELILFVIGGKVDIRVCIEDLVVDDVDGEVSIIEGSCAGELDVSIIEEFYVDVFVVVYLDDDGALIVEAGCSFLLFLFF